MPRKIFLSPSSISLFVDCPRCFWLRFNKNINRPAGIFPSLPSGMDLVLKEHFDHHRANGSHPRELESIKGKLYPDLDKLNVWRNNRKGLRHEDQRSGIGLMGVLDDLLITEKDTYAPVDFKTRGYPLKEDTHEYYQNQMDIYSFLLEENGMKAANFAVLLFYHPKQVNGFCNVEFHADTIKVPTNKERGKRIFHEASACLLGKEPKVENCEWCNWNKLIRNYNPNKVTYLI